MIVGVVKETCPGENRVALVPAALTPLIKASLACLVQSNAGVAAGYPDAAYEQKGARIAASREEVFATADVIVQVRSLGANLEAGITDLGLVRQGQTLIGFCDPLSQPEPAQQLAARGVTLFSMELIPRITKAQSMDALSSMATIAGYKAVLLAAGALPKMFPMLMTAAGTIPPARVLVLGAGVAGLAGHCHGAAVGRRGRGLRRSPRRQGAGHEPGREVPRPAAGNRRRPRRRRLRQGLRRVVLQATARTDAQGRGRQRRGDHHRGGARPQGADLGHDGNGRRDAARLGDCRSGGRTRRQLRADDGRATQSRTKA